MNLKLLLKKLLLVLMVVAVIALIAIALRPQPLLVESAAVRNGALQVTIEAEGKTRVHDKFIIAAPIAGRLSRIDLQRGDVVAANAVVARIDPLPLAPLDPRQRAEAVARISAAQSLQQQAEAIVAQIRAQCEQTRRERERAETLVEQGDVPRQDYERARNAETTCQQELSAAKFKAAAAASEVEAAKAALISLDQQPPNRPATAALVHAPAGGKVLRLIEESERVVLAGAPLLELSNPAHLEVVIEVLSTDAVRIKPGAEVKIENWGGERSLSAKVRMIEPSAFTRISALGVEEQRVNVIADFTEPVNALGDGYRIEARVVVWQSSDVLLAPASALFRKGEGWSVFTIDGGIARERSVTVGHRNALDVEITQGLNQDTLLILHPPNELTEGTRVRTK